jgi:hypothetical protein
MKQLGEKPSKIPEIRALCRPALQLTYNLCWGRNSIILFKGKEKQSIQYDSIKANTIK